MTFVKLTYVEFGVSIKGYQTKPFASAGCGGRINNMMKAFYLRFGFLGLPLAVVLWFFLESFKDAFFGWFNSKIGEALGMADFSVEQTYPILTTYLPLALAAVVAFSIVWVAIRFGRGLPRKSSDIQEQDTEKVFTPTEFINLRDAVMDAWECIRNLPQFDEPPPSLPQFGSLREYYEDDPVKMPGIVAQVIFNAADPPIPIKGISPPRTVMEIIPADKAAEYGFSDDATELFDWFDEDKPSNQRKRYINLQVKRVDIERRIKDMERVE